MGRRLNQDAGLIFPRAPPAPRRHRVAEGAARAADAGSSGRAVHPSGRTREPHPGCLRLRLRPPRSRRQPGTRTRPLRAAPRREGDGAEAACPARGQLCPAGPWAARGRGGSPSATAGEQSLPKGSSWLQAPGQLALESGTQTSPGALPRGVSMSGCTWGAFSRSPRTSASPAPAASQLREPVRPGGHRQTAGSAAGSQEPPARRRGPRQRKGGRRGVRLRSLPTLSARLSPKPSSPGPRPGCPARRAQRPAPRSQPREEARRGGRPGHCAAGAASLGCPCADSGRAEPQGCELRTGPATRLPVHPVRRSRRVWGGPFICNTEESALQSGPAPTHPPAPGNQPGRSPES